MCEDSDTDVSDWDIENRNWKKLAKEIELVGFSEGAAKGRDSSLQEGFNQGLLEGFKLGQYFGMIKGINECQSKLGLVDTEREQNNEKHLSDLWNETCVLCSKEKSNETQKSYSNFKEFISEQQTKSNELISTIENSDFKPWFEKG